MRRLATITALTISAAILTAPAKAADVPPAFTSSQFQTVDVATHPSFIVTAGQGSHYVSTTELATAAQEYGINGTPGPRQLDAYVSAQQYDNFLAGAPQGVSTQGASDMALGDLTGDNSLESVYLADGQLILTGGQAGGFRYLGHTDVPTTASAVEIMEGESGDPLILVATGRAYSAQPAGNEFAGFRWTGSALQEVPLRWFEPGRGTLALQPDFDPLEDVVHRADWDKYLVESDAQADDLLGYATLRNGDVNVGFLQLTWDANQPTLSQFIDETQVSAFGREVQQAHMAYDLERVVTIGQFNQQQITWSPRVAVGLQYPNGTGPGNPARQVVTAGFTLNAFDNWVADNGSYDTACNDNQLVGAPRVDVEFIEDRGAVACSSVVPTTETLDQLRVGYAQWSTSTLSSGRQVTNSLGDAAFGLIRDPQPQVIEPCLWLLETHKRTPEDNAQFKTCSSGSAQYAANGGPQSYDLGFQDGIRGVSVIAGAGPAGGGYQPVYVNAASWDRNGAQKTSRFTVRAYDSAVTPLQGFVAKMLPHQRNTMRVQVYQDANTVPDPALAPRIIQADPYPVAFLAAPPQVAAAGQDVDPPVFASSQTTGSSQSTSTSTRLGAYLGIDYEDPLGAFAVEVKAAFENEAEQGTDVSREVTTSQAFSGISDQDVVVYRNVRLQQYKGTVLESSTGIAQDSIIDIGIPLGATTSASSVKSLKLRFPAVFGPGPDSLAPALNQFFDHEVGDPGSYRGYGQNGSGVSGYCDGTLDPSGDRELKTFDPLIPATPFTPGKPADPPQPDILVSDVHQVLVGSPNSEGASFDISNAITNSRVVSNSVDLEAGFTAGYVQGGITGGFTWSQGWSQSLGEGVSFESGVGHIPGWNDDLENEQYDWRSFLCQKTIDLGNARGSLTAWVLNYTVDGYQGSGGLAVMDPVELDEPLASQTVASYRPALTFTQPQGTVKQYTIDLQAVGANDVHSLTIDYPTIADSRANRPASDSVTPQRDLLPGQLYRWRVSAKDFFDNEVVSEYEFFQTPAQQVAPDPVAAFDVDDRKPQVGQEVSFSNSSTNATGFEWDFGDGTTSTDASPSHTYTRAGTYTVELLATAPGKPDGRVTRVIQVAAAVNDDAFVALEDTDLEGNVFDNDLGATSLQIVAGPSRGSLVDSADDGSFRYRPEADFCGTDSFVYSADGNPIRPTAVVRISVSCVDDAVGTKPDRYAVLEDQVLQVPAPGVLGNDSNPDGGAAAVQAVLQPVHGTLVLRVDGGLTYTPAADFCGPDSFTYSAGAAAETVNLDVVCVNDPPTARNDLATVDEDGEVDIAVLDNDSDPDGAVSGPALVDRPESGRARFDSGVLQYTPKRDFCGRDVVTYRLKDGPGSFDEAQVRLRVTCINDAATTRPDEYSRDGQRRLIVEERDGLLGNDTDIDSPDRLLRAELVAGPRGVRVLRNGGFRLRLPAGFDPARLTFTYRVWDSQTWSAPERVVITRS